MLEKYRFYVGNVCVVEGFIWFGLVLGLCREKKVHTVETGNN